LLSEAKIVDGILIAMSILLALLAGGSIYHLLKKQLKEADDLTPAEREGAEEAIVDVEEGAPLLRDFSDEEPDEEEQNKGGQGSVEPSIK
jgi:hypothetical protein